VSDVTHWDRWTPTVTKAEALDGAVLSPRRRFKICQLKLRPATWFVTAVQAPSSFTWESRSMGMVMMAEHYLCPDGADRTDLSLKFSFSGLLGAIVGRMSKRIVQNNLDIEAASLLKHMEARSFGSRSSESSPV
jgi:hypothetical protein